MEQIRQFRDYQEQVAADHRLLQEYARGSLDHLVGDVVTSARRYAGFAVVKTAQVEVQVAVGRFYDAGGAVYNRETSLTQSLTSYLPAAAQRYVAVSAYGQEVDINDEERDFLVDVDTGATEPQTVKMTRARQAVISFTSGAESADPQAPPLPSSHTLIALVLLDPTQVVSVTMQTQNAVSSTEGLDVRARSLETWRTQTEPRITSLGSDLASLANEVANRGSSTDLSRVYEDLARIKARLEIPDAASDYGADRFLTTDFSDVDNVATLGFDALVEEGIRFPDANADLFEADIFSANDPNAALSGGILLPAYDSIIKMAIDAYHSDLGIAQYGFQTIDTVQMTMSRQRLRYGTIFTVCTNSSWWQSGSFDSTTGTFQKDGETFELVGLEDNYGKGHEILRLRQVWTDTYKEPYWAAVSIDHEIQGALVAQSVLASSDMWLTKLGFYLTSKAANENVIMTLVELTNGAPDLTKAVLHQVVPHASLVVNGWTRTTVTPTFLKAGKRYALILISNANHRIGMAYGQKYLDGTFFYSTDGVYYQGDLTKDMMIELWGAKFRSPQVTIPLESLNLDGGIRNIDILAGAVVPKSTELVYQVQPNGSGVWRSLSTEDIAAFASTPPLVNFRAAFIGSQDIMPGLQIDGSQIKLSRPKLAFKHISTVQTLDTASDDITVKLLVEDFDDTPHDVGCRLRIGAGWETPDTTTVVLLDAADKRYEITYNFQLGATTSSFRIEVTGATNSAGNTFHVSERIFWAV